MDLLDVTEIEELTASKVSAVDRPANGAPWLLVKAAAAAPAADPDAPEDDGTVDGKPDPKKPFGGKKAQPFKAKDAKKSDSAEADEVENTVTDDGGDAQAATAKSSSTEADAFQASTADGPQTGPKGGVPDNSTDTPTEGGHLATGTSGLGGNETGAPTPLNPTSGGGASAYPIAAEAEADLTKALAVSSLLQAMDQLAEQRQLLKDGKYLSAPAPSAPDPAMSLAEVATSLAAAGASLDALQAQCQIQAALGNDTGDLWDLQDATQALEFALGVAARLSFQQDAAKSDGVVEKAYRRLTAGDRAAVQAASDQLTSVLSAFEQAGAAGAPNSDEGELIQMELTKSEFVAGVVEIFKAQAKEERKAAKRAAKLEKISANNNGDPENETVNGTIDENLGGVPNGGQVAAQYVNKGEQESSDVAEVVKTELKAVREAVETRLGALEEQVKKVAKRPRSGGPILDGQPRIADEGRQSETVAKSASDTEIEKLTKALEDATDPQSRDYAALMLTRARLTQVHEHEFGGRNPISAPAQPLT